MGGNILTSFMYDVNGVVWYRKTSTGYKMRCLSRKEILRPRRKVVDGPRATTCGNSVAFRLGNVNIAHLEEIYS